MEHGKTHRNCLFYFNRRHPAPTVSGPHSPPPKATAIGRPPSLAKSQNLLKLTRPTSRSSLHLPLLGDRCRVPIKNELQANLYNPVYESFIELDKMRSACAQRSLYGDIFLLLHLMDPLIKVDDAIKKFEYFYLYAGFDCTTKWANFLGDVQRKTTMAARLQETLGVTQIEIRTCRENVKTGLWNLVDVASALEECLLGKRSGAPSSLADNMIPDRAKDCPADDVGERNPVLRYLAEPSHAAWTKRSCWDGPPGHSAMKPRKRDLQPWREQPLPTLKWTCRMCEAEFPNVETLARHIDLIHGQYRFYSTFLGGTYSQSPL